MIEQFGFTSPREVIAALFLLSGLVFFVGSAIGMLRLPDFYSRIHASGNSETLGCTLSFIGLMIYEGPTLTAAKMAFVFLLVFMANPIGSHILSKAAYKSGHPVWTLQSEGAKKLVGLEKADHSADEPVGHIRKKPAKQIVIRYINILRRKEINKMEIYTIEALLLVFLILITCAVIFCKDILSAAIIYSAFSFCAVLLYLMMGSPDVAFTEAVIGTISTIFFVASLKKLIGGVNNAWISCCYPSDYDRHVLLCRNLPARNW